MATQYSDLSATYIFDKEEFAGMDVLGCQANACYVLAMLPMDITVKKRRRDIFHLHSY